MVPKEAIPKDPITYPMVASVPPTFFMYSGKRKKAEKLQKKKKFDTIASTKFLYSVPLRKEIIAVSYNVIVKII